MLDGAHSCLDAGTAFTSADNLAPLHWAASGTEVDWNSLEDQASTIAVAAAAATEKIFENWI